MKTITQRVDSISPDRRPRVYYARGPRGLETGLGGSINVETIELVAQNVAGGTRGGLANVSIEQVLLWNPDVIITIDQDFAANVSSDPAWAPVAAVRAHRVHLSPKLPFGCRFPPDGEPVDRPMVACENPVPGFVPGGFARTDARVLCALLPRDAERCANRAGAGGPRLKRYPVETSCLAASSQASSSRWACSRSGSSSRSPSDAIPSRSPSSSRFSSRGLPAAQPRSHRRSKTSCCWFAARAWPRRRWWVPHSRSPAPRSRASFAIRWSRPTFLAPPQGRRSAPCSASISLSASSALRAWPLSADSSRSPPSTSSARCCIRAIRSWCWSLLVSSLALCSAPASVW